MSEEKPSYLTLQPEFKVVGALRLMEIKAETEGKEYKGSTLEDIGITSEKLGEKLNEKELKKRIKYANQWDFIRVVPDSEKKRPLIIIDYSIRKREEIDRLLEVIGLIEVEPRKVKLKVEI